MLQSRQIKTLPSDFYNSSSRFAAGLEEHYLHSCLTSEGLYLRTLRTLGHFKAVDRIGLARIEWRCIPRQIFHQAEFVRPDTFNDAPGQFVTAIVVVVRA